METSSVSGKSLDQQLVERVQRGDRRAFDMLVVKYQSKVLAIIARYIRDQAEVADVAQEAFIKAYRAIASFRGDSQFYTWLYRIAINTAKNYLVSKGRRPPGSDVELEDAVFYEGGASLKDIESPEQHLHRDQLQSAIYAAIEGLPEDLKAALTLREFDGLSYEEIADIMQCPVGTVRSRIFRARDAVDAHIAPLLESRANVG
ncbi:RNA polymerase sigma factor RpoE [Hahella ganghwensis]|uniref:RNA polymerase sigma factor RpoE n=1 Tax=Hahella ganghwensis TaxID=286420 RepID=UPI000375C041